ncbi:AAA family ATPase [Lysinibacillus sphaericus]|uniref:AAA family ATPase n=1 Tax=Lysinibacillus sphaericus TaxID=1421 RepID=UPI00055EE22D|nr:AAA family ATPase [Lysinibacillus sphaericus]
MKKIFLPKLVKIEINNFSLYSQEPSFSYEFKNGINAIIGVNGIGKTTFIELILYCLVGARRKYTLNKKKKEITFEKKNQDYFSSRFNDNFDTNEQADAVLDFKVENDVITISRSLFHDEIKFVKLNGEILPITEEEKYNDFIIERLGFYNFEALQKIIRDFLVFDEQRLNVAWEMNNQDEILRILLLDGSQDERFYALENKIISLDSTGRHLSEDRRIARERLALLYEEREKLLSRVKNDEETDDVKIDEKLDYNELINIKNTLELEMSTIEEEIELMLASIESVSYEVNKYIGERNILNQDLETIENYISKEEVKLYNSVYDKLPDYYYTLEKGLVNEGKCLACSTKSNELKQKFRENKEMHSCLVCGSKLEEEIELDPEIITTINRYNDQRERLLIQIKNRQNDIDKSKEKYSKLDKEVNNLLKSKEQKSSQLIQIESLVSQYKNDVPADTYSQLVLNLDNQIIELSNEVKRIYEERDALKLELEKIQDNFVSSIALMNRELSIYFNKYASTFLGLECELTMKRQKIRSIPHVQFMPKVNGAERGDIYSVSESQRFFLDQAFRMAIIDFLQNKIKGFEVFFITETPEGSLDIAYEEQVAEMFTIFAKSNNNIIFTSNLNSSNFLSKIFKKIDKTDRERRILNMLEKGNLTKVHKEYEQVLSDKLVTIYETGETNDK